MGASVAYHKQSLAQAIVALRENPRLMQLHLTYNFPLIGFQRMTRDQLDEEYWRYSHHRQMLLISAWQSASSYLDEMQEIKTRREMDRIIQGDNQGFTGDEDGLERNK